MERTRFFRRPSFIWVGLAVLVAILLSLYWGGGSNPTDVKSSDVLTQISANPSNISKAVIHDKEQTVELDLRTPAHFEGMSTSATTDKIQAQFPALSMDQVFDQITAAQKAQPANAQFTVDTDVSK